MLCAVPRPGVLLLPTLLAFLLLPGCGDPEPAPALPADAGAFLAGWAEPSGDAIDEATGYPTRIRRLKDGAEMVLIPAGTFWMGAVPGDELAKQAKDEHPRHEVTLTRAYYLDVYEVTNAQFERFADETDHVTAPELSGDAAVFTPQAADEHDAWHDTLGAYWRAPWSGATRPDDWARLPVVFVSWDDARDYCAWAGTTLPTEAEFERALRAGKEGAIYPWGDTLPPPAGSGNFQDKNFRAALGEGATGAFADYDDGYLRTAPVGSYPPNAYGVHDLSGNVWEWCFDGFEADFYASSPRTDPVGRVVDSGRVRRGGGWMTGSGGRLRCSWRGVADATVCRDYLGFRCVRRLP